MALSESSKGRLFAKIRRRNYAETLEKERASLNQKSRFINLTRYMNIQRQEVEDERKDQNANEESAAREREKERENDLSRELDKIKKEDLKRELLRQQLRENSPELRDLERKLRAAYTRKELCAQMARKEQEKRNEKIQDKRTYEILMTGWVSQAEHNKKLAQEDIYKKAAYRQELQEQIILKDHSNRAAYEELLREKKNLDDIIQRIHDEDERERQEKACKMKKTQQETVAFEEAQELWKKKKMDEIDEENRKIQEYLMSKCADIKAKQDEKDRQERIKALISENIAKQIFAEKTKAKEREDIIKDVIEEDEKEKIEKRHREEVEKQERLKVEIRTSLHAQMEERIRARQQLADEDAKYKEELIAKIASDNKKDAEDAQKRRMKELQNRREVERMMIERRQKHAEEMQLNINLYEQDQMEAQRRQEIIEEERRVIINEHIKDVLGYLPKGLLKQEDIPFLEASVVDHLSSKAARQ